MEITYYDVHMSGHGTSSNTYSDESCIIYVDTYFSSIPKQILVDEEVKTNMYHLAGMISKIL